MAKGSILDLASGSFFLFGAVLIIFISYTFVTSFNEAATATGVGNTAVLDSLESGMRLFDAGVALLFFGVAAAIIIGSYFLKADPIFMVASLLMWAFVIIVVAQASNMYYAVSTTSSMASTVSSFPIIDSLMQNLPVLFSIIAVVAIIALYIQHRRATFI